MHAIEFDNVSYSYGGERKALDGVTFSIDEGEFVSIIGSNGSGKSTLARHMNGLAIPDGGEVRVFGVATSEARRIFDTRSNVGMVFQNPDDQIVASIVEDDIAFGPENLGIEPAVIRDRVTRALDRVGLAGFEKRSIDTLSGGQKQRVAIAGALAMEPRVLVFDEADAMLDPYGRAELMDVCRQLNAEGVAIVFITHFMEAAACASRVIALDAGHVAIDGSADEALTQAGELTALGLDAPFAVRMGEGLRAHGMHVAVSIDEDALAVEVKRRFCSRAGVPTGDSSSRSCVQDARPVNEAAGGESAIEFDNVAFSYDGKPRARRSKGASDQVFGGLALRDASFKLEQGEMLGVAGRTGSGKSTLVQLCNGLLEPTNGRVSVCGRALADRKAIMRARREVGVVFQYPEHQLFAATVFDDVAFGLRNLGLGEDEVAHRVDAALAAVSLDLAELRDASPFALSGGQQRRVAIAGVLAMEPRVLVLDEPLAGLDPRSRKAFIDLIGGLGKREARSAIVVSHDMDALAQLCDRILVLDAGEMRALGTPADVFADEGMIRDAGLDVPATLRFARALGVERAFSQVPTVDELAGLVAEMADSDQGRVPMQSR